MSVMLRPATASEIVEICGHLEDGVIARVLATGASPAEILEGFTWATAGVVYEILMQEEPDPKELGR